MTDSYLYPYGPTKDPRLLPRQSVNVRGAIDDCKDESPWYAVTVMPRTNVKGKHFGSDLPQYKCVLEYNRVTEEYRTRPLTEVLNL